MKTLIAEIMKNAALARDGRISNVELFRAAERPSGRHEFLFFIKPEIFEPGAPVKTEAVLELMLSKIQAAGLSIANVRMLGAGYLEAHNIIAQHYGVINKLASDAAANLSDAAKAAFEKEFGAKVSDVKLLGGLQFMQKYPFLTADAMEVLWQNVTFKKLAGGTYCAPVKVDGETFYVVNGFHAKQLMHFIEKGRSILVFTLVGDISWSDARNSFLGATDPSKAKDGSIRRILLERMSEFGLKVVAPSNNGAHLSAGPVEGLVELMRYNSDFSTGKGIEMEEFTFGKALAARFSKESVEKILGNADLVIGGKKVSVFDLTEEKNADEAIELLAGAGL